VPSDNGQDRQCSQSVEFFYPFHAVDVAGLDRASSGLPCSGLVFLTPKRQA
jgi:hypothetical protein